jgi:hypothetical protein
MKITYLRQNEIRSEYQVIFWYIFLVEDISEWEETQLIEFVHSDYFKEFVKPDIVKQTPSERNRFLKGAFNLSNLGFTDFRVFEKEGLIRFFNEYAQSGDWGEDRTEFITIMNSFNHLIENETINKFFLISKEWFRQGDQILSQDSEIYTYYFLILWVNTARKTINVCEWNYD